MIRNISPRCWRLLVFFGLYVLVCAGTHAQISFIQITDPHIFDDVKQPIENRLDNKAALASCIDNINQRVANNRATYDFVVMTGDLGIEKLFYGVDEKDFQTVDDRIRSGASELASLLILSKVRRWLFVPGNNDVAGEEPEKIRYYHFFIEALADEVRKASNDFEIIDLCPRDNTGASQKYDSTPRLFRIKEKSKYAFIGFDNTSFKNTDPQDKRLTVKRIDANFDLQKRHVDQVIGLLRDASIVYAYVFYHIPEIDDPHLVSLDDKTDDIKTRNASKALTGDSYVRSAWFVKKEVRDRWKQVVTNPKVFGLFAGHFHDPRRNTYRNFEWMTSSETYLPESLAKLHVCPPLALKFQDASTERARGFQEVYIDDAGAVSTRIFWLEQAGWNLSTEIAAAEATSLQQLELGLTYENLDRLKEAEAAYLKASENNWQPTRQKALTSLRQVVAKQDSWPAWFDQYLFVPLGAAWNTGMTGLFTLLPTFLFVLGVYLFMRRRGKKRGRYQVRIGPILNSPNSTAGTIFEQIARMIHGRMRTHYKRRNLIRGVPRLPMIASSQSEEVATLVESSIPGGLGKVMALLIRRTDRPRYSIEGVMNSEYFLRNTRSFISLMDAGEPLKSWNEETNADEFIARHRLLVYLAFRHLVRHMNR